jgi:hypothetical protein
MRLLKFWHEVMQCGGVGVREHGSVLPLLLSSQVMSHAVAVKVKAGLGCVVLMWLVCSCSEADSGLAVTPPALSPVPAAAAQPATGTVKSTVTAAADTAATIAALQQ